MEKYLEKHFITFGKCWTNIGKMLEYWQCLDIFEKYLEYLKYLQRIRIFKTYLEICGNSWKDLEDLDRFGILKRFRIFRIFRILPWKLGPCF